LTSRETLAMGGSAAKPQTKESEKNHYAEKILRETAHGRNRGRSTESMVYGKRRKSDASLQSILRDPVVLNAFRRYLELELAEELILYWMEVDKLMDLVMEKVAAEDIDMRARHIFAKFLADGAKFAIEIDSATREDIARSLKFNAKPSNSSSRRNSIGPGSDPEDIQRAFEVSFIKVFQKLKFEYMPRFLVSEQFMGLDVFKDSFENQQAACAAGLAYAADMDLEYMLSSPLALQILKEFFFSVEGNKFALSEEMVEVVREIDDFREAACNNHRMKRLHLIFKRFEPLRSDAKELLEENADHHLGLQGEEIVPLHNLQVAFQDYEKNKVDWEARQAPPKLLDDARVEALAYLNKEMFPAFRNSPYFEKLTGRVSRIFKKDMHEIDSKSLKSFAEERKFEEYKEIHDVDLKELLQDSLGLHYFRKFAVRHFQEENVLFWCEVNYYNNGEYAKPPVGTALQYNGILEVAELQEMRAKRILRKYLEPNARMELNLEYRLKEDVRSQILKDEIETGMFDVAQKEIYNLMNRNLWSKFCNSELFESWQSKRTARFERRLSSLKGADLKRAAEEALRRK